MMTIVAEGRERKKKKKMLKEEKPRTSPSLNIPSPQPCKKSKFSTKPISVMASARAEMDGHLR
jgi:hypothetical protein